MASHKIGFFHNGMQESFKPHFEAFEARLQGRDGRRNLKSMGGGRSNPESSRKPHPRAARRRRHGPGRWGRSAIRGGSKGSAGDRVQSQTGRFRQCRGSGWSRARQEPRQSWYKHDGSCRADVRAGCGETAVAERGAGRRRRNTDRRSQQCSASWARGAIQEDRGCGTAHEPDPCSQGCRQPRSDRSGVQGLKGWPAGCRAAGDCRLIIQQFQERSGHVRRRNAGDISVARVCGGWGLHELRSQDLRSV